MVKIIVVDKSGELEEISYEDTLSSIHKVAGYKTKRNFSIHKDSSTKLVIEFHNNEPKDIYFISNNNIDNISVIEDISYITRMIL